MDQLFTELEIQKIIMALAVSRGEKGFSEEETDRLQTWCEQIKMAYLLLTMVLGGKLMVDMKDGHDDPAFLKADEEEMKVMHARLAEGLPLVVDPKAAASSVLKQLGIKEQKDK